VRGIAGYAFRAGGTWPYQPVMARSYVRHGAVWTLARVALALCPACATAVALSLRSYFAGQPTIRIYGRALSDAEGATVMARL
jgi:hypothetical protein